MKQKNMCNHILLIIVYITIMLRFLNLFDPELQLINAKPVIKNKLKQLLSELETFRQYQSQTISKGMLVIAKLIASDSDIAEALKSMHQNRYDKNKKLCQ